MEITINQAGRFYDDFPDAFCRGTETEEDEFRACFFDQKPIVNRDAGLFKEKINVGACAYMKWNFGCISPDGEIIEIEKRLGISTQSSKVNPDTFSPTRISTVLRSFSDWIVLK